MRRSVVSCAYELWHHRQKFGRPAPPERAREADSEMAADRDRDRKREREGGEREEGRGVSAEERAAAIAIIGLVYFLEPSRKLARPHSVY